MGKGKYQDWLTHEGLTKLEGWARDGLTDEQIANNIGIGTTTLYNWKKRYVEIVEALKREKKSLIVKSKVHFYDVPRDIRQLTISTK